jgi:hypothetical protein
MESLKNVELTSELSVSEVLGEQGAVLPERALMRHRRRSLLGNQGTALAFANNGSAANAANVNQFGIGNTSSITQSNTVVNIG